jgi:hypothetical protein
VVSHVLRHIRGHQDLHTPYVTLSLKAQLNVNADAKARSYQSIHSKQRPIIPAQLPLNWVQLHIAGKVISSKAKKQIRETFTFPPYLAYICKRFQWTDACVDTINWNAYTQGGWPV